MWGPYRLNDMMIVMASKAKAVSKRIPFVSARRSQTKAKNRVLDVSRRECEMNWLARNQDLSERFGGNWIVLEKDELVASDIDYRKAREVASRRGIKRPFIIFVPPKESGGFMGI